MADTHPPQHTISSLKFATIGKEPDLLKRISAPEPNQDYRDNATDSHSPSHSPPVQHSDFPTSRPSLLQALTAVSKSHESHPASAAPQRSIFDESYAALYRSNTRLAPSSPPASRSGTSSDMDWSPIATLSRSSSASHPSDNSTASASIPQARLPAAKSRHTSPDALSSLELAYPATESAPNPRPGDSSIVPSVNPRGVHPSPITELPARLLDFISFIDSVAVLRSNVLAGMNTLERDLQVISTLSSLGLENAQIVETHAQTSLSTARESVTLSEIVSLAQAAKQRTDQAFVTLAQLRCLCENEFRDAEQGRADLISSATSLKHDMETVYEFITEQGGHREAVQPTGLPPNVLMAMSIEVARMKHVRESTLGIRKRKRSQEDIDPDIDNDLPRPLKEARVGQRIVSFDKVLEMEAEVAREAWDRAAERRSAVPPDIAVRTVEDEAVPEKHTQLVERDAFMAESTREPNCMKQITEHLVAAPPGQCLPVLEPSEKDHPSQNIDPEEMQGRRRELEEGRLEAARFQLREQESQESGAKRKRVERKTENTGQWKEGLPAIVSPSLNAMASKEGTEMPCTVQPKTARKKEIEMQLATEKQVSAALQPAQAVGVVQALFPQTLTVQKALSAKDGVLESQIVSQRSSEQSRNIEKHEEQERKRQEIAEENRKAEVGIAMKIQTENVNLKERNYGSPEVKMSKPILASSVGNVVAQQTVTTLPVKARSKKSHSETPSAPVQSSTEKAKPVQTIQGVNLPPRPLQAPTQSPSGENVSQSIRNPVPPIGCIVEPNDTSSTAALSSPQVKPTATVSQEAQSANLRFIRTTTSSAGPAVPHLKLSTHAVVPKVEIQSPTIAHSSTVQHPLPHSPPNNNIQSVSNTPYQSMTNNSNHHVNDSQTHKRFDQSENTTNRLGFVEHGNITTVANKSISHTSPSTSASEARTHVNPPLESNYSMNIVSNSGTVKNETRAPARSNKPPPTSFHTASTTLSHANRLGSSRGETRPSRGWAYGSPPHSPPRSLPVTGRRCPYDLDDDECHRSPGQEQRGRRNCLTSRIGSTYASRPSSGSPPTRALGGSRLNSPLPSGESRSLAMRIEGTSDLDVFRTTDGGEVYPPMHDAYRSPSPMDIPSIPLTSRLHDRFSGPVDALLPPRRPQTGRRGGMEGPLPLELRIS